MISVYSVSNLLTVIYHRYSVDFQLLGNTYAAVALASFFNLLSNWVAPDLHSQKEYFRGEDPNEFGWPLAWLYRNCIWHLDFDGAPRSGLTWFNVHATHAFQGLVKTVEMLTKSLRYFDAESSNTP